MAVIAAVFLFVLLQGIAIVYVAMCVILSHALIVMDYNCVTRNVHNL